MSTLRFKGMFRNLSESLIMESQCTPEFLKYVQSHKGVKTQISAICPQCKKTYYRSRSGFVRTFSPSVNKKYIFCSSECAAVFHTKSVNMQCGQCGEECIKQQVEIKKSKSGHMFCSRSCAAIYNNKNKKHGYTRSKIELFIEEQIKLEFPNLQFVCNDVETIGLELDFYFPDLKFALELNGIFHYEPIYGQNTFDRIQHNDNQKIIKCYQNDIELCVLDIASIKNFSSKAKEQYKNIVIEQILRPIAARA